MGIVFFGLVMLLQVFALLTAVFGGKAWEYLRATKGVFYPYEYRSYRKTQNMFYIMLFITVLLFVAVVATKHDIGTTNRDFNILHGCLEGIQVVLYLLSGRSLGKYLAQENKQLPKESIAYVLLAVLTFILSLVA